MAGIIDRLKYQFDCAPSLKRLIYINVAVFIAVHLVSVVLMLFNVDTMHWLSYIEVPSALHVLPYRVWTLFTYMFVHYDLWHILFNMMWLYWFGTIFMQYFSLFCRKGWYDVWSFGLYHGYCFCHHIACSQL